MIRIGLAYFDVGNLGDKVIYETARFIVKKILCEMNISEYEFVPIDIGSAKCRAQKLSLIHRIKQRHVENQIVKHLNSNDANKLRKSYYLKWRLSKDKIWFDKYEKNKLNDVDLVFFCGGGLIKYHAQNFHHFLDDITSIADKKNIPIIISAAGVEGYDENDVRCQILKQAINRECVKYISTRDDYNSLVSNYIYNKNIVLRSVCDPAVYTKDYYEVEEVRNSKKIGLGVIRNNIFKQYMYYINRERMIDMYFALAKRFVEYGYQVEFFCNGLKNDARMINRIFSTYPSLKNKYKVTKKIPRTTIELVNTINSYNRFLAVRLHASIIGYSLEIPSVALVWNNKQILFGKQTGTESNYLTKENFNDEIIYKKMSELKKPTLNQEFKESNYKSVKEALELVINQIME